MNITLPLNNGIISTLNAGDRVFLNGTIYTARDAAHKRMFELLDSGLPLPFNLKNQIIYYVGPCPAREHEIIGSAGPTTSGRMDFYTPRLLDMGLKGMIGKGLRSPAVLESIVKNSAVYFAAIGGEGALLAKKITGCSVIAFDDLRTEAVYKLTVKDFPVITAIDCHGKNAYETERAKYTLY